MTVNKIDEIEKEFQERKEFKQAKVKQIFEEIQAVLDKHNANIDISVAETMWGSWGVDIDVELEDVIRDGENIGNHNDYIAENISEISFKDLVKKL
jgi:hypothetical protein